MLCIHDFEFLFICHNFFFICSPVCVCVCGCRFFEANPDYVKLFPFDNHEDIEAVLKSSTLKMHAGRVMTALSSIVDNLNDPIVFEENLQKIIISHVQRNIELKQFENLTILIVFLNIHSFALNHQSLGDLFCLSG